MDRPCSFNFEIMNRSIELLLLPSGTLIVTRGFHDHQSSLTFSFAGDAEVNAKAAIIGTMPEHFVNIGYK
jgi:hypothetical protein